MTQNDTLNVKLSNSQLNKLKSGIKINTEAILKLSSNAVGDSNDETNFPHKLLLANAQVSRLGKDFVNGSSANIELSITQLLKIWQSGGFLGRLLGPSLEIDLPLIGNVLKLFNSSSISNRCSYSWKMFGSGTTTLIISNEKMIDITIIVKLLEKSGLLIKDVSETIKNKAKEQKDRFLCMLLGTLGGSLLGNLLTG